MKRRACLSGIYIALDRKEALFMWFQQWIAQAYAFAFEENAIVAAVFFTACALVLLSSLIAISLESLGAYVGVSAVVGGGAWIAATLQAVSWRTCTFLIACFSVFCGIVYVVLWSVLAWRARRRKRRAERERLARAVQFTLPEKENSFIRARLNTVLHVNERNENREIATPQFLEREKEEGTGEETKATELPLSHAMKLLTKLRQAQTSAADKLSVAELLVLITSYKNKPALTAGELRTLNDAFSAVLKLAGKYSV